ncbi:sulfolactate dehydrogenase [Acuticoccus sediminis]|uniref:Sulfolactate dehydrogenase n=1 Tax=Acuticoccus sediminis TaxID=2184697 RepID=A0A8B2NS05_9HYPH|nr:Ldh family oxidoreductase [Acuticoccus sediminis]RAI01691.1 sulfolactate dehydrogenase [Acuticoccus sediminis]
MADTTRMSVAEIEEFAAGMLQAAGTSPDNAAPLAKAIAAAEREGIASHGLMYLPIYMEHVKCGKVSGTAVPGVTHPKPGTILVDAGTGFAHPAIAIGFAALVPAAQACGIAVLAVSNSYNCGVLGYHTEALAAEGLLGIGFTNSPASIAPAGGAKPVIGTNPMSVAAPDGAGGAALLIDQSASVVAKSEVMKRAREGEPIPLGWALDADGNPTEDADAALKGSMAPAAGYKGVGWGLLTELLAAVATGATLGIDASPFSGTKGGPPRTGQMFIAIDVATTSGGAFAERLSALTAAIGAQEGVRLPGAKRAAARARADAEGVAVPTAILDKARALLA